MSKMYDELAPWWPLLSPAADYEEEDWLRLLTEAGFEDVRVVPLEHSQVEPGAHEVFVARRQRQHLLHTSDDGRSVSKFDIFRRAHAVAENGRGSRVG